MAPRKTPKTSEPTDSDNLHKGSFLGDDDTDSGSYRYSNYDNNYGSYNKPRQDMNPEEKVIEANAMTPRDFSIMFRNRRRMAWISLFAILLVTCALMSPLISVERVKSLEMAITWFYMSMASIVGAYMGFSTWAYISLLGKNKY